MTANSDHDQEQRRGGGDDGDDSVTISCVNLDKFINFFEPQFSHL